MANLLNGDAFGHPCVPHLRQSTTMACGSVGRSDRLFLSFVALLLFGSFKHAKGQVFVLYAILYSTARFFLEFLRGDYVNLTLGLKSAQMTSLVAIIVGICVFIYLGYLEKKNQTVMLLQSQQLKSKRRK